MLAYFFPILKAVDSFLGYVLPAAVRLVLWGAVSGAVVISLYALLSDQEGIRSLKEKSRQLQRNMFAADVDFARYMALAGQNLRVVFRMTGKITVAVIPAFVFVLIVVEWVNMFYSYDVPQEGDVSVEVSSAGNNLMFEPAGAFEKHSGKIRFVPGAVSSNQDVVIRHEGTVVYAGDPLHPPTRSIKKKNWWNWVLANPAGYVSKSTQVEKIRFGFPRRVFVKWLPPWLGSWELLFFLPLCVVVFWIKFKYKIK